MPRQEGKHVKRPKGTAKHVAQRMISVDKKQATKRKQQVRTLQTTRPL